MEELTDDEEFLELVDHFLHQRIPQVYRDRPDHFLKWNENDFKKRFRLSKHVVNFITDSIAEVISSRTNK